MERRTDVSIDELLHHERYTPEELARLLGNPTPMDRAQRSPRLGLNSRLSPMLPATRSGRNGDRRSRTLV